MATVLILLAMLLMLVGSGLLAASMVRASWRLALAAAVVFSSGTIIFGTLVATS